MKKLLLLSALLIFACSSDDSNSSNNSDGIDYFFEIEFGGETHEIRGNTTENNFNPLSKWGLCDGRGTFDASVLVKKRFGLTFGSHALYVAAWLFMHASGMFMFMFVFVPMCNAC